LARLDPRKPKEANIRRAISTAYYGLFHHLIDEGGQLLLGTANSDWPLAALCARAYGHGEMKAACKQLVLITPIDILKPLWSKFGVSANTDIKFIAKEFVSLQELRHAADYDLNRYFTRLEAIDVVNRAKKAVAAWNHLKAHNRDCARLAAIVMLLWKNLQNR